MPEENVEPASPAFELEYVTSAVSVLPNDGIVVHVVNDSSVAESTRVVIYRNTGAGAITVVDTGRVTVTPTWTWSLGFTVKEPGEYWLRIQASSEALIPKASFERLDGGIWKPVVSYRPGDFAVFSLTRKRLW
ncbi:MAG: hypothetical protein QOH06_3885 [Acidobacteriota bacterium]|nr:hypothetical protein [Acidobacteriota bacterium]